MTRRLRDPLLYGIKVIRLPIGTVMVKCQARCYPGKGERLDGMVDAHTWAKWHRQDYPDHDARWTAKLADRTAGAADE